MRLGIGFGLGPLRISQRIGAPRIGGRSRRRSWPSSVDALMDWLFPTPRRKPLSTAEYMGGGIVAIAVLCVVEATSLGTLVVVGLTLVIAALVVMVAMAAYTYRQEARSRRLIPVASPSPRRELSDGEIARLADVFLARERQAMRREEFLARETARIRAMRRAS